jgi:hypothetical protein
MYSMYFVSAPDGEQTSIVECMRKKAPHAQLQINKIWII